MNLNKVLRAVSLGANILGAVAEKATPVSPVKETEDATLCDRYYAAIVILLGEHDLYRCHINFDQLVNDVRKYQNSVVQGLERDPPNPLPVSMGL